MNALIVHAHENPESFCSALAYTAREELNNRGYNAEISDLYGLGFDAVGSKRDFEQLSDRAYYKYPMEQFHASQNDCFESSLQSEMTKLMNADLLIFNFPLWWYSVPAILKGWIDRVMAYGVAYGAGTEGRFNGKRAFMAVTTGSTFSADDKPIDDVLNHISEGVLGYVGFDVLPTFIGYGVSRITQDQRLEILEAYRRVLQQV